MKIAVFGNIFRETILSQVATLLDHFQNKDIRFFIDQELFDFLQKHQINTTNTQAIVDDQFEADLALSIGGDGTFLNTAARVGRKNIPILGINIGRLGFLADIPAQETIAAITAFLENKYKTEERSLLFVESSDNSTFDFPYALNEVAILKQDSSSMIGITTKLNGEPVHNYQSDGLIVATPTGSTAYSLSVGGPILVPQAQNFIISPVASHSLTVRPLIIPDTWKIELDVASRSNCYLIAIDGRSKVLEDSAKITISKADFTIKIVNQLNHTFFDTLRNKLLWGMDKRN